MTRPAFFFASLYGIDVAKGPADSSGRPVVGVVSVALGIQDYGALLTQVGGPPSEADFWAGLEWAPCLVVLPARSPRHPETAEQAAADPCLTVLERVYGEARTPLTLDVVLRLVELTRGVVVRAQSARIRHRGSGRLGRVCDAQPAASPGEAYVLFDGASRPSSVPARHIEYLDDGAASPSERA